MKVRRRNSDKRGRAGLKRKQFCNLSQNNVSIALDEGRRRIYIGIDRDDLDLSGSARVIGAVGSNMVWNDRPDDPGRGIF